MKRILLSGANGLLGQQIKAQLDCAQVQLLSRQFMANHENYSQFDMQSFTNEQLLKLPVCETLVHCAPIWCLLTSLEAMIKQCQLKRLIVFSSSSVVTKSDATDQSDKDLAQQLAKGEQIITDLSEKYGLSFVILRPTMIYGRGRDENITRLSNFIKKRRFFVVAGKANGLRQPVHVDDLADLAVTLCNQNIPQECSNNNPELNSGNYLGNRAYMVSGAEVLSYMQLLRRLFAHHQLPPIIIHIPVRLYRLLLKLSPNAGPGMADRMNQHLVFSHLEASQDLGFQPRAFTMDESTIAVSE